MEQQWQYGTFSACWLKRGILCPMCSSQMLCELQTHQARWTISGEQTASFKAINKLHLVTFFVCSLSGYFQLVSHHAMSLLSEAPACPGC